MADPTIAKQRQDYDPDPPRCFSCVYFRRAPLKKFAERTVTSRGGQRRTVRVCITKNRINPVVETCTFGNFEVTGRGVCDEWRSRSGERIQEAT